jgi:hypothetical protein
MDANRRPQERPERLENGFQENCVQPRMPAAAFCAQCRCEAFSHSLGFDAFLTVRIRLDQTGIDRKGFPADQSLMEAPITAWR